MTATTPMTIPIGLRTVAEPYVTPGLLEPILREHNVSSFFLEDGTSLLHPLHSMVLCQVEVDLEKHIRFLCFI